MTGIHVIFLMKRMIENEEDFSSNEEEEKKIKQDMFEQFKTLVLRKRKSIFGKMNLVILLFGFLA